MNSHKIEIFHLFRHYIHNTVTRTVSNILDEQYEQLRHPKHSHVNITLLQIEFHFH